MSSLGERSRMLPQVLGWLTGQFEVADWKQAQWQLARETLVRQGIAPYLYAQTKETGVLPAEFLAWMESEYRANRARIERFEQDLSSILAAARKAGVELLLLKGLNLAHHYYPHHHLRVMADLDLVMHPADSRTMQTALEGLGYELKEASNDHLFFIRPGNCTVVSVKGEHPDNPRPVEMHWGLQRFYHNPKTGYNLSEFLWEQSQVVKLYGEPVRVPSPERLLVYMAAHTVQHLLLETGRLIQWLDLAHVATRAKLKGIAATAMQAKLNNPVWVYLSLTLVGRALASTFPALGQLGLQDLEPHIPKRLVQWAKTIPLDRSCGLTVYASHEEVKQGQIYRITSPWRAAFAYPGLPLPLALAGQGLYGLRKLLAR